MEAKYYTPTISELFVGFECEKQNQVLIATELGNSIDFQQRYPESKYTPKSTFAPYIIDSRDIQLLELNPHVLESEVRVKYLDSVDIESLGWKHNPNLDNEEIPDLFDLHGYSFGFVSSREGYFLWKFPDGLVLINKYSENSSDERIFKGTVQNKSVLRQVMSMLNIETKSESDRLASVIAKYNLSKYKADFDAGDETKKPGIKSAIARVMFAGLKSTMPKEDIDVLMRYFLPDSQSTFVNAYNFEK